MKAKQVLSNLNRSLYLTSIGKERLNHHGVTVLYTDPSGLDCIVLIPSDNPIVYVIMNEHGMRRIDSYSSYPGYSLKTRAHNQVIELIDSYPNLDFEIIGYGPK